MTVEVHQYQSDMNDSTGLVKKGPNKIMSRAISEKDISSRKIFHTHHPLFSPYHEDRKWQDIIPNLVLYTDRPRYKLKSLCLPGRTKRRRDQAHLTL